METAPGLDRRADDDELRPALGRNARDLLAEAPGPCADDLSPHRDAVGARHRLGAPEPLLQTRELPVEVGVDRQLELEDGRRDENDPGAAIGREAAGQIERVLGLLLVEQRHDDAPVGDRARPAREVPRAKVERPDVGQLHRIS